MPALRAFHGLSRSCLLVLSCLAGCQDSNSGLQEIAVIPKGTLHEFWKSIHAGAIKAERELGDVKIIWKGPIKESSAAMAPH